MSKSANLLFKLLVILTVFDGIRSWMVVLGPQLSFLKEGIVFLLLVSIAEKRRGGMSVKHMLQANFPMVLYLVVLATPIIFFNDFKNIASLSIYRGDMPNPFVIHFKTIESLLLVLVFLNYEVVTGHTFNNIVGFFIRTCVVSILFTLLVYFVVDLSFLFEAHWGGRISIGYPPSDTQVLCFGLVALLFGEPSLRWKVLTGVVLVVGILMNATGTGLLSLGFIGLLLIWQRMFYAKKKVSPRRLLIAVLVLLFSFGFYKTLEAVGVRKVINFSVFFEKKWEKVSALVESQWNDKVVLEDRSVEIREKQIEVAFFVKNDLFSWTFGGPISIGTLIENENFFLLRSYGYVGIGIYYLWLLGFLWKAWKNRKTRSGRLLIAVVGILTLSNLSVITTYLFGIASSFALLLAYSLKLIDTKRTQSPTTTITSSN